MIASRTAVLTLLLLAAPAARAADPAPPAAEGSSGASAPAEKPSGGSEPATKAEVAALAEEIRQLKLERDIPEAEYRSFAGMGPAASKVYFVPKGLSIGGYGELVYRNNLDDLPNDTTDLLRVVLYLGYRFNEKILFNAEVEYEHQREVFVEFAYLDFLLHDAARLRVGNVLVPMGFVNELHEPVFFNGVNRPEVERNIIPSTWNENGVGLHGELLPGLTYKAYGLFGLNAARKPAASSWIRDLRTRGANSPSGNALAETFAAAGNLTYATGPATVGVSAYRGRSGQGQTVSATDTRVISGDVTMVEAHGGFAWRGVQLRALGVQGELDDADLISAKHGLTGTSVVASRVRGGYLEAGFDVLSLVASEASLVPFLRWEALRLHDRVPEGGTKDPARSYDLVTTGLTYKPIPTVALKADWQWRKTDQAAGAVTHALNVGAAYVF